MQHQGVLQDFCWLGRTFDHGSGDLLQRWDAPLCGEGVARLLAVVLMCEAALLVWRSQQYGEVEIVRSFFVVLYLISRHMRPEGPWQRRSRCLNNVVAFTNNRIPSQIDLLDPSRAS